MSDQHDKANKAAAPVYTIDNPPPRLSPADHAEANWERMRASPTFSERLLGHFRPRILERAPIQLYGISGRFFLYRDAAGERRALRANDHDRNGIAALFVGAQGWLCRLWPDGDGGWDDDHASETLMYFQACVGLVDATEFGFELPHDPLS